MTEKKSCKNGACSSTKLDELLSENEIDFKSIFECENCTMQMHSHIETITGTLTGISENYLMSAQSGIYSILNEELDIEKMSLNVPNKPLPKYLKKFVDNDLISSNQENLSLLCIISESLKVFDIFGRGLVERSFAPIPAFRSGNAALKYKVLEEEDENVKFSYQFIKESDDLVYLTIQLSPKKEKSFLEVELNMDDRLLISSKINELGVVNFPNLQEGKYKLNFRGKNLLKSVDLTIYAE